MDSSLHLGGYHVACGEVLFDGQRDDHHRQYLADYSNAQLRAASLTKSAWPRSSLKSGKF